MCIVGLDHVQLSMPAGEEDAARRFYVGVLGMTESAKPENLARRGGAWFSNESVKIHLGVDQAFHPARKAHPAFLVRDLSQLRSRCEAAGVQTTEDEPLPGFKRFFVHDPFGNRIEFLEPLPV